MRIDTGQHLRLGQQMKLAPRMIQSMEILQMPMQALEERLEEELSSNPTLELREVSADARELKAERMQEKRDGSEGERRLLVGERASDKGQSDDFERLSNFSRENGDSWDANTLEGGEFRRARQDNGEGDAKSDALANSPARAASIADQLMDQWVMIDTLPAVIEIGKWLIGFIDDDGYLRVSMDELEKQAPEGTDKSLIEPTILVMQENLEPVGIAARNLRECLLRQIDARESEEDAPDLSLERRIVSEFLAEVETNQLPKIAKETGTDVAEVKRAITNLRQFDPHPGRRLIVADQRTIVPDAIVEFDEENDRYVARLFDGRLPQVQINTSYADMARDGSVDKRTKEFINTSLRSARWLLDAVEQRRHTLLRVIHAVLEEQRDFFDVGPQALKPLPMTKVADQLGIHVATVSRAVSEKYLQTPRGIYPLRMFFSGGTSTDSGEAMSWTAVQSKLREVIDAEDKSKPLSDDALVDELKKLGIEIARRTVAKYRKEMDIPAKRQRKQFS